MELTRSMLSRNTLYKYKNNVNTAAETLSEEEDEGHRSDGADSMRSQEAGGPFSALTPSMWPQGIAANFDQPPEDETGQVDFRYNEFGFKVEVEDGPEQNSSKLLSTPFTENASHRLKWMAHLEFAHNTDLSNFALDQVNAHLPHSQKLFDMVIHGGIPHSLRPHIWPRLCGALDKKKQSSSTYQEIVNASSNENLMTSKQIEKDLLRTLPSHACFCSMNSTGIARLRRILRAIAWLYPDIGYCQGTGVIIASLLLYLEEEEAFWLVSAIIEDLLPPSYFSHTLLGVQADQQVLAELITNYLPTIDQAMKAHDVEISLITMHWFLTVFSSVLHPKILLRVWDWFFYEGSIVLFKITLGMLKMKEEQLTSLDNSAAIFNALSDIPSSIDDMDELLTITVDLTHSLTYGLIESHRRKILAYLMADNGAIINPEQTKNLPKQHLTKRRIHHSRSMISSFLWGESEQDDGKAKNIKQTEHLVDLRDAILQIARHFQLLERDNTEINLNADYSVESHSLDLGNYVKVVERRRRRAKALVDFERHDEDELGFRKNDIVNIMSMKDEHCWVGELNGLVGWFPAKFVELLDERSKSYSLAGDDSVSEAITDLVRGILCPALKGIFEHGLKPSKLGVAVHPWMFIEEAVDKDVGKDYDAVYSRLVLCKTFRLDEDGKVLTPEEVLYRAVQSVNSTHNSAHAQLDVKFRSLICLGLNEQVLHLWLESLCTNEKVVRKWYDRWSFLRSPGWVQIKCELRLLSQFAFNLGQDFEICKSKEKIWEAQFLDNVKEMLVKYHLFSWELPSP